MTEAAAARGNLVPGKQITKGVSLLEPLSSGGMGAVWLADHQGLKTRVVVKFMLVGLDSSESACTRFSREAAAAAQVKSPHVVQMLDHGVTDDGVPFIVMEHLEGHDLGDEIEQRGALEPGTVVAIVMQVAKALSKVHAAGLLHRDIKPDNIFLCAGEDDVFAKLLDFGIAKSSTLDQSEGSLDGETKTGQIVGTPFYMSPEQVTAQKSIDHRSDLWALGVVAYQALTGTRPYDGPSFGALAVRIATGNPPRPTDVNPALPPTVDSWFAKACARNAGDRFASAKEMAEALRGAFEGIVSLPSSSVNSDSGARSTGVSAPQASHDLVALAATALDDSDVLRRNGSLARSEAGLSIAGNARTGARSSPLFFFGGIVVLAVGVGGALVWSMRTPANVIRTETAGRPSDALPTPKPQGRDSVGASAATATPSVAASVAPAADAAVSAPSASVQPRVPPTARGVPAAPPASAVPVEPTSKPTSTEPDLF